MQEMDKSKNKLSCREGERVGGRDKAEGGEQKFKREGEREEVINATRA